MTDDTGATPASELDLEARLRHALAAKAGDGPVGAADWGDLSARLAWATRRRQRVLAGAAGVALLVGAAGGYFGEAAASPGPLAARAGGSASATRGGTSSGADRALAPSPSGLAAPRLCPGATSSSSGTEVGAANREFIRTTADGVTIRVYQMPSSGVTCVEPPTPLAGAGGTGGTGGTVSSGTASGSAGSPRSSIMQIVPASPEVTVELSDGDAVGQGAIVSPECLVQPGSGITNGSGATGGAVLPPVSPTPADTSPITTPTPTTTTIAPTTTTTVTPTTTTPATTPPSQPQQLTTGSFGVQEGDPVWWVAVEVDSSVASVRMTFPGGSTDQMAPVNGIAVLAGRVAPTVAAADPGPYVVRGTLDLLGADGSVLKTVTLPQEPVAVPAPVPLQGGVAQGAPTVTPGAIIACPQAAAAAPQGQSSATTEKR